MLVFYSLHVSLYVQYVCILTAALFTPVCESKVFLACPFSLQDILMAIMENVTQPHSYIPHYLLRDDPFASKLSKEADIVAAFYICIVGKYLIVKNCLSLPLQAFIDFVCFLTASGIKSCCNKPLVF